MALGLHEAVCTSCSGSCTVCLAAIFAAALASQERRVCSAIESTDAQTDALITRHAPSARIVVASGPAAVAPIPRAQPLAATLRQGDIAVDATAGVGHDAAILASLVGPGGTLHAVDVDAAALEACTQRVRDEAGETNAACLRTSAQSHAAPPPGLAPRSATVVAFNLGFLGFLPTRARGDEKNRRRRTQTQRSSAGVVGPRRSPARAATRPWPFIPGIRRARGRPSRSGAGCGASRRRRAAPPRTRP